MDEKFQLLFLHKTDTIIISFRYEVLQDKAVLWKHRAESLGKIREET